MGLFVNYQDSDEQESVLYGLYIEEHYKTQWPLIPFLGVGVGYGESKPDGADLEDEDGWVGRLTGGVKLPLTDSVALSAQVYYYFAQEELWLEDDGEAEKHSWQGGIGLRWLF